MGLLERTRQKFSVVGELLEFLWVRRLWWLVPMVLVLIVFGLLLVMTHGSALAPFIYTLF